MRGSRKTQEARQFDVLVGRRIELTRKAVGISGDDLAAAAGISRSGLYYLECGRTSCSPLVLSRIASALGVSANALVPKVRVCEQVCEHAEQRA